MHLARHTFATELRRVARIDTTSQAIGHADLNKTLGIYGHRDQTDLEVAMEAYTRVARRDGGRHRASRSQPLMSTPSMVTEDRVVEAVCRKLVANGYSIVRRASAVQHGYDIVARKDGRDLIIEAKGAGSSKTGTARYGMEFNAGQVFDHVAKAVLKAMRIVSSGIARAGVALPDNQSHGREIAQVSSALREAGVAVFWVNDRDEVRVDAPWKL